MIISKCTFYNVLTLVSCERLCQICFREKWKLLAEKYESDAVSSSNIYHFLISVDKNRAHYATIYTCKKCDLQTLSILLVSIGKYGNCYHQIKKYSLFWLSPALVLSSSLLLWLRTDPICKKKWEVDITTSSSHALMYYHYHPLGEKKNGLQILAMSIAVFSSIFALSRHTAKLTLPQTISHSSVPYSWFYFYFPRFGLWLLLLYIVTFNFPSWPLAWILLTGFLSLPLLFNIYTKKLTSHNQSQD